MKAIKERHVILLDLDDVLMLYAKGLLTREDVIDVLRSGLYRQASVDDLVRFYETGYLSSGVYIPRGRKELEKLKDILTKEEFEKLLKHLGSLF